MLYPSDGIATSSPKERMTALFLFPVFTLRGNRLGLCFDGNREYADESKKQS